MIFGQLWCLRLHQRRTEYKYLENKHCKVLVSCSEEKIHEDLKIDKRTDRQTLALLELLLCSEKGWWVLWINFIYLLCTAQHFENVCHPGILMWHSILCRMPGCDCDWCQGAVPAVRWLREGGVHQVRGGDQHSAPRGPQWSPHHRGHRQHRHHIITQGTYDTAQPSECRNRNHFSSSDRHFLSTYQTSR